MRRWVKQRHIAVFLGFCLILFSSAATASATEITATSTSIEQNVLTYTLTGLTPPSYNVSERFAPFRVVLDMNDSTFAVDPAELPPNSFVQMQLEELQDSTISSGKRFIFTLANSHDYNVKQKDNQVIVTFTPANDIATPTISPKKNTVTLQDLQVVSTPNSTSVQIRANKPIDDYTVDKSTTSNTLPQVFIDIPDVNIDRLTKEKVINSSALARVEVSPKGDGGRIIFESATSELFSYSVAPTPSGLEVVINESRMTENSPPVSSPPASAKEKNSVQKSNLDEIIKTSEEIAHQDPETRLANTPLDKLTSLEEKFSLSGYKTQRITVDFYKIDIHNVFRLFREITDLNIIVDEAVEGSLTLALNDVPWDFALDIVLNLMNLQKKERFNTIVIYPAGKEFVWPTRAEENLSFQPDMEIIKEQDALVVEQTEKQPAEILKAKEFLQQAQHLEKRNDLENAILLYDKALTLWPSNGNLSNKLARIHLVQLGMNAQALNYANQTLQHHPKSRTAALYAAIASANMQRLSQANEYFIRSISDTPPMREALLSYASFCENNSRNEAALKLLSKYEEVYGENSNTMITKARIFDKNGQKKQAKEQYKSVLTSGYQITPDLRQYILQRIGEKTQQ